MFQYQFFDSHVIMTKYHNININERLISGSTALLVSDVQMIVNYICTV